MSRSCKECAHHNPDFIDKVCLHCSWPEFAGEPSNFKPKPVTNYDRLVRKSPKELAEYLAERSVAPSCTGKCHKDYEVYGELRTFCHNCLLDWLKQEATNDP